MVVKNAKLNQLNFFERTIGINIKSGGIGKKIDSIKLTKPSNRLEFDV